MPIGQPFVVDPEKMEDGCVEVMDRAPVLDGVVTEFIRASVTQAPSYSRARHPHRKSVRMMIPAHRAITLLGCRGPTKFSSPKDESILEESPGLEVENQSSDGFVDLANIERVSFFEVGVLVPLLIVEFK